MKLTPPAVEWRLARGNFALLALALFLCMAAAGQTTRASAALAPLRLQTEGQVDPFGVDAMQPRLSWQLRSTSPGRRSLRQTGYRILVASSVGALQRDHGDAWDSGRIESAAQIEIPYNGKALQPQTAYHWKVMVWDQDEHASRWSAPALWYSGMLQPSQWKALWIAAESDRPRLPPTREGVDLPQTAPTPLPLFRRSFTLQRHVTSAVVAVSGLGQYELRVNGKNVTTAVMNPSWTNYRKRVFYNMYDVTRLLGSGENVLAVTLGNGMYNVPNVPGRYAKFTGSFGQPKLLLQLTVRYDDGATTTLVSDRSWSTSPGPILLSSIYGGEDYDARRDLSGWEHPRYDARDWTAAEEVEGPGGTLMAQMLQPVAVARTLSPVRDVHFTPRTTVYDLGANFAGWPDILVRGPRGSTVKLLPGELLDANGHVTQASINAHPGWENSFQYTLKGGRAEAWHPQFSYNGFRYVEVTLSPAPGEKSPARLPRVLRLNGSFLHARVHVDGRMTSSNRLFGEIHRLIDQAILSNMFSVLTDCPTREKLGWLEQTHLAAASIMNNYGVRDLYEKMAEDMADAQLPDGLVPAIAPEFVAFVDAAGKSTAFRDSPEWGSAFILSPLAAYRFYGDTALLARHFDMMDKYVNYLRAKATDHILSYGLGDWYDIGPGEPGVSQLTSRGLTATAIYYQDLIAMAEICRILDNGRATTYTEEAALVQEAFNRAFFHPETGSYDRGSQTANAMPLALGLVPPTHRREVMEHLIADIRAHQDHVTAGDVGFHYVVRALTDGGRSDVLADMLSRTDAPSYGFQLAHGATSLTEAWDSNPTSSQNHFMLGHAEEWFYRGLAGIDIDLSRSAEQRITLRPTPVLQVRHASATVESVYGQVAAGWRRTHAGMRYDFTVPAGQTATLIIPLSGTVRVTESHQPVQVGRGILAVTRSSDSVTCVAGSGTYHFSTASAE